MERSLLQFKRRKKNQNYQVLSFSGCPAFPFPTLSMWFDNEHIIRGLDIRNRMICSHLLENSCKFMRIIIKRVAFKWEWVIKYHSILKKYSMDLKTIGCLWVVRLWILKIYFTSLYFLIFYNKHTLLYNKKIRIRCWFWV